MGKESEVNYLKKELYELIKTDESIFDFIQESSLDGLWYWDLERPENEWMNPKFWTVLGYNPEEMPNKSSSWQSIINKDDLITATENFNLHCENADHPYDQIVRYTHKNGSTVWIRCRGIAIRDENGKPIRMLGAHHDISNLKNTEQELLKSKNEIIKSGEIYKNIIESIPIGMFIYQYIAPDELYLLQGNQSSEKLTGLKLSDWIGKEFNEIWPNAQKQGITDSYLSVARTGVGIDLEDTYYEDERVSGAFRIYAFKFDEDKIAIAFLNITDIKKAEQKLNLLNNDLIIAKEKAEENELLYKQKHELLSLFIKHSPIYTFVKQIDDNSSSVLYASDNFIDMIGISGNEMIGKNMYELFPPEFAKKITDDDIKVVNNGEIIKVNEDFDNKNYLTIKFPIIQKNNCLLAGYTIDVTESKKFENELRIAKEKAEESDAKYSSIVNILPDGVIIHVNGKIVFANKTVLDILGYDNIIGRNAIEFVHPDYRALAIDRIKNSIQYGTISQYIEEVFINSKGEEVNVLVCGLPFKYEGHDAMLTVFTDITKLKQTEQCLIEAKDKAEESDRLKTAFLQNMSHEIRTPMNAIMGFSSLLSSNFNDKEKLENFSRIIDSRCNDLLDIITDILDISKIESGQNSINVENCNINELFNELTLFFNDYKVRLKKKDLNFQFHYHSDQALAFIKTDKLKLKQILINLVVNALKFTEAGRVDCGYRIENGKIQFYVSDTGIGIPEDKYQFIFERFSQLKHPTLQIAGGTGLGLPIVKGLVKLLGGNVWLESECNKGTTFYFTIDYVKADITSIKDKVPETSKELITTKTILIVEDDQYNAEYLKEVLNKVASNILTVTNGRSAIKMANEHKIDLILMDIRLPDMSGYEATHLILKENPKMKIIAQSAYAANTEYQKAIESGCVDYISKPTTQEKIFMLIYKYLK